jgi:MFS family permease
VISSTISVPVIYLAGSLSNRFGRRPLILTGATIMALWAFPFF